MTLEKWVNKEVIQNEINLKNNFKENKPFEHISINNFLIEEIAIKLKREILNEEFYLEDHDLYQFLRTVDIKNLKSDFLKEFREFIFSKEFVEFISNIVSEKLSSKKGDLHALKLLNTHYLLCHDDQVQDRSVAFILQLSETFSKKEGGSLDLFDTNEKQEPKSIVKSITPTFNSFNMFLVSSKSFHQISEVTTDKKRISISGWFYEN